jgi:hypothetical protein
MKTCRNLTFGEEARRHQKSDRDSIPYFVLLQCLTSLTHTPSCNGGDPARVIAMLARARLVASPVYLGVTSGKSHNTLKLLSHGPELGPEPLERHSALSVPLFPPFLRTFFNIT